MTSFPINPLPWSWTRISLAQRCSQAAFMSFNNLVGRRLQAGLRRETRIGLALHRVADFLMQSSGGVVVTIPDSYNIPPQIFRSLGTFVSVELPKLKRMFDVEPQLLSELQVRLDRNLQPVYGWPNGFIVGTLDLCLYDPTTGSAIIVDYKTGDLSEEFLVSYYRPQLELYALLFNQGFAPLNRIGLVIHAGSTGNVHWLTDGLEEYNQEVALGHLTAALESALGNLGELQYQPNALCKFCEFRTLCPKYEEEE